MEPPLPFRMLAIPEYQVNGRPWLIGQESWFVLGYHFAHIRNVGDYRMWLRHTFTDDMLRQWTRTWMCTQLPPPWQTVLAAEFRRRRLMPCKECGALVKRRRPADLLVPAICEGCAARLLAEEVHGGVGRR